MTIEFSRAKVKYGCFSNFYHCGVVYGGLTYNNSESAWQAQKVTDEEERSKFCSLAPSQAKKLGRSVTLRPDWECVKYDLMKDVCYAKFLQNKELGDILKSTGNSELLENTTGWHDNEWGSCSCPRCADIEGKNLLGKALMEVRDRLKYDIMVVNKLMFGNQVYGVVVSIGGTYRCSLSISKALELCVPDINIIHLMDYPKIDIVPAGKNHYGVVSNSSGYFDEFKDTPLDYFGDKRLYYGYYFDKEYIVELDSSLALDRMFKERING